jgi:glycosyltransferase involved in cell wall biosynthesis
MSVFNGERYLDQQLNSIANQTFTDWKLIVRNNGSTDGTKDILKSFSDAHLNKVEIIEADHTEPFIPLSFGDALLRSTAPYIMFSDGDDVWMDDKIEVTMNAMLKMQASQKCGMPLLIHTDLVLVDSDLNLISDSMWRSQGLDPERKKLNQVIMHSNACGNTFMFNSELRDLILPIPADCIMHDYWTSSIAAAFGQIGTVNRGTIKYRQHQVNACGAESLSLLNFIQKITQITAIKQRIEAKYVFAQLMLDRFGSRLKPELI